MVVGSCWKECHALVKNVTNYRVTICDDACVLITLIGATELSFFILL